MAEKVSLTDSSSVSKTALGKRKQVDVQTLIPGVESEAVEEKLRAILAATEWIATGKGEGAGPKMRDLVEKYSVKH